jgi:two-component system, OmpR family, response regulator
MRSTMASPPSKLEAALKIHLLLVDDEPDFSEVLHKFLSRNGIRLSVADCCAGALDILADQEIDVIIMDMNLPEIDGIECLRRVKEHLPLVEVIILTGHASVQSGIEGMQGGAFDYCLKPIDVQELIDKIELAAQKALINREESTS